MIGLLSSLMGGGAGGGDPLAQMLQRLQSGGPQVTPGAAPAAPPMPGPQAAPTPDVGQPPAPPSLLDRVGHALGAAEHGLGSVAGDVSDHLRPQAPAGYEGLLTPDEIKSARPGLLKSIFYSHDEGSPEDRYAHNLDGIVQRKQATIGLAQQARVMAVRQSLMQQYPPPQSGSEQEVATWANKVLPYLMAHGDYDGVKQLQPIVDQFAKNLHTRPFEAQLFKNKQTGEMRYLDPNSSTDVPQGFEPVMKPGANGMGTAQVWSNGKGGFMSVMPGDEAKMQQAATQGYKPDVDQRTASVQMNINDRAQTAGERTDAKTFLTNTKPLRERGAVIDQATKTISDALNSPNPDMRKTLYSSAVANFIQAADQKATIRYQLLNYFKDNVDPSIAGKWSVLRSRLIDGALPGYTMQAMLEHLHNLRDLTMQQYSAQRDGYVKRNANMDNLLPDVDEYFPDYSGGATAPSAAGAGSAPTKAAPATGKPNVNDVEAYLKALRSKKP